jgi:hypothetical protein
MRRPLCRGLLFHQEAVAVRSRYQGGAYAPRRIMRSWSAKGVPRQASAAAVAPSEPTRTAQCVARMSLLAVSLGIGRRVPTW